MTEVPKSPAASKTLCQPQAGESIVSCMPAFGSSISAQRREAKTQGDLPVSPNRKPAAAVSPSSTPNTQGYGPRTLVLINP